MPIRPDMSLSEYLAIFRKRKWAFLFGALVVLFLASVYCALAPRRYKSTTAILLVPQRVPENFVRSTVGSRIEDRLSTLQQQVMSRTRLLTVAEELHLFRGDSRATSVEETVATMRKRIDIQIRGNDAFSLSFTHEDPRVAMLVASRLASFFIDENLKMREQQAVGTSEFLESQLQQTKAQLEAQEERVKRYKMKYMGELPQQTEANLHMLSRLQDRERTVSDSLRSAEDRKAFLEARLALLERPAAAEQNYERTQATPAEAVALPAADPAAGFVSEYNARRARLAEITTRYTDRHPEVIRLKREIELLEGRIADARRTSSVREAGGSSSAASVAPPFVPPPVTSPVNDEIRRLRADIAAVGIEIGSLRREKEEIRKNIAVYEAKVDQAPKREQELIALTRDYDNLRRSYDDLLSKRLQADISQNLEKRQKGEQFQILDPANLPDQPVEPNKKKIFLLALFLAFTVGFASVVLTEFFDDTVRTPEEFRLSVKLPLIASLPSITDEDGARRGQWKRSIALGGGASILAAATVLLAIYGDAVHAAIKGLRISG